MYNFMKQNYIEVERGIDSLKQLKDPKRKKLIEKKAKN